MAVVPAYTEELIIEAGRSERNYWRDLWRYRELFYILTWRDIRVRYKQTVIGILWSVLRPLVTMVVFTLVFNRIARMDSGLSAPYALMVYAGMMPWTFFSTALTESSMSLINNTNLISKVYFPRLILPASSVITSLVDFFISLAFMSVLLLWYAFQPGWQVFFLPLFILLAFLASVGAGIYITALNVKYRDFKYIVPFIVQFGMYVSPVGFNSNIIEERWRWLFALNPMVGIIDGFRWCLLRGEQPLHEDTLLTSLGVSVLLLYAGIRRFRKMEKSFADFI